MRDCDRSGEVRLGEVLRIRHGYAFKGEYFSDSGPYVLLTPGNFHEEGGFRSKGASEKYYRGPVDPAYVLNEGDVIVAMTEQAEGLLASSALVPESGRFLHNQRLGRVEPLDAEILDLRYAYYLFNTRTVRSQVRATANGAKVRHTSPSRIYEVRVSLPCVRTQRKIAAVLSAYDDLIENNNRRIQILEEMARSLYREWFVDFRFPGHQDAEIVDSQLGRHPKNWLATTLSELVEEVRRGRDPNGLDPTTPYVGLEHIPRRSITLREWGHAGEVQSTKLAFHQGEILFGKIRPYFHKVVLAPIEGVCSTDAIVLAPRSRDLLPLALGCTSSDEFVAQATQTSQGTKMPRANWGVLKRYPVFLPPEPLFS